MLTSHSYFLYPPAILHLLQISLWSFIIASVSQLSFHATIKKQSDFGAVKARKLLSRSTLASAVLQSNTFVFADCRFLLISSCLLKVSEPSGPAGRDWNKPGRESLNTAKTELWILFIFWASSIWLCIWSLKRKKGTVNTQLCLNGAAVVCWGFTVRGKWCNLIIFWYQNVWWAVRAEEKPHVTELFFPCH